MTDKQLTANQRISLFQLQHIADYSKEQFSGGVFRLQEQDLRRVTDFLLDDKAVKHLPQELLYKTREFYPFKIRVGENVFEIYVETTNEILPELICKIIDNRVLEREQPMLKEFYGKLNAIQTFVGLAMRGLPHKDKAAIIQFVEDEKKQLQRLYPNGDSPSNG